MFWNGFVTSMFIFLIENMFDLILCPKDVRRMKRIDFPLYMKGKQLEFLNLIVVGPALYGLFGSFFIVMDERYFEPLKFLFMIIIQNTSYYFIHKWMHDSNVSIHKFHHLYHRIILPSTANCVTVSEFIVAYLSPLFLGALLTFPTEVTFLLTTFVISIFNIFVHTNVFEKVPYLSFLVSPTKHLTHHRKKTKHYASPIFDCEYFISLFSSD